MPTEKSKLYCLTCLKLFSTPKWLQYHFRTTHLKKKKGALCFCGAELASVKNWRMHEKVKHYDPEVHGNMYICDCCDKT